MAFRIMMSTCAGFFIDIKDTCTIHVNSDLLKIKVCNLWNDAKKFSQLINNQ